MTSLIGFFGVSLAFGLALTAAQAERALESERAERLALRRPTEPTP